jgi:hypothetical protein
MASSSPCSPGRYINVFKRALWLAAFLPALVAGCALVPPEARRALAAPYKPANVYLREAALPPDLRRVAVLPLPLNRDYSSQADGAELLAPVFATELSKRHLFEVICVTPEQLPAPAGTTGWSADGKLPQNLLQRLHDLTGCDAVIFVNLTVFQPYPPLSTGWKARLVDCTRQQTWWAVDEVFDASNISVVAAAQAYARAELNQPNPLLADSGVLHSPRRFGQYTASAVASTLPTR